MMTKDELTFLSSQKFCKILTIATNTQSTKIPQTSLYQVLLSQISYFVFSFFPPSDFLLFFFFFFDLLNAHSARFKIQQQGPH